MRFAELKSQDQLDMQTLHRIARSVGRGADGSDQSVACDPAGARDGCAAGQAEARSVSERTDGRARRSRLEPANCSPRRRRSRAMGRTRSTNLCLRRRVRQLGEGERRGSPADDNPRHRRDRRIGAIVASALVAAVGRAESFDRGRDLAAWLGLVPRQFTSGGKPKLLGISKRGNKYLRRQLIHGGRAALPYVADRDTPLGRWAKELSGRAHRNVAIVAFANKLVRIAWAVLRRGERFAATGMPMAA